MTPLIPALPAATRRFMVSTTSSPVNGEPSCHFTSCRSLKVQTLLSSLGDHVSARPGPMSPVAGSRAARNSNDWAMRPYEARSCMPIGSSGPAGRWMATRIVPPAAGRRGRGARGGCRAAAGAGCRRAGGVAAGRDDRADGRQREPQDGGPLHERTTRDPATREGLDEVEFLGRGVAADRIQPGIVHRPVVLSNGAQPDRRMASAGPPPRPGDVKPMGSPWTVGERYPRALGLSTLHHIVAQGPSGVIRHGRRRVAGSQAPVRLPRRAYGPACSMRTVTSRPTRSCGPRRWTSLLPRVRPARATAPDRGAARRPPRRRSGRGRGRAAG